MEKVYEKTFVLKEDIPSVAKSGTEFNLDDGYYGDKAGNVFIKSTNENYKLFKHVRKARLLRH